MCILTPAQEMLPKLRLRGCTHSLSSQSLKSAQGDRQGTPLNLSIRVTRTQSILGTLGGPEKPCWREHMPELILTGFTEEEEGESHNK